MTDKKLIIFVKNEELGHVKTRLAKAIGDEKALLAYQKLIEVTARQAAKLQVKKEVWYSSYIAGNDSWDEQQFTKKLQKGADLGERMSHAFKEAFEEGIKKAVIIGSDCADLTAEILQEAFNALDDADFVVGPAEDGGYYLLGMRRYNPELFQGISWSTGSVLESTKDRIAEIGGVIYQLQLLNDVDTIDDWERVKDHL
ncbi:MAG: TIGR04282 family arsenosugar biosynthesis glycosyltransferase [Gracilimonas sp.]|nr:TIGR04282 family arsenosugar biosynthesis glycosyltransferase [Gracilimonas sp.]